MRVAKSAVAEILSRWAGHWPFQFVETRG